MSIRRDPQYLDCYMKLAGLCKSFFESDKQLGKGDKKAIAEALSVLKEAADTRSQTPVAKKYQVILKPFLDGNSRVTDTAAEVARNSLLHIRRYVWNVT